VRAGDRVGVVGRSGAGKSSLVAAILLLIEPAPDAALRPLAQAQFIFERVAGRHRCLVRARHNLMHQICAISKISS
jgi:ABC-type glutathione transport system ATPase component